jgi:hypothetical protein
MDGRSISRRWSSSRGEGDGFILVLDGVLPNPDAPPGAPPARRQDSSQALEHVHVGCKSQ